MTSFVCEPRFEHKVNRKSRGFSKSCGATLLKMPKKNRNKAEAAENIEENLSNEISKLEGVTFFLHTDLSDMKSPAG